jgi:hypothetical protein
MRILDRMRVCLNPVERDVSTGERRTPLGPDRTHRREVLLEASPAIGERHADRGELALDVPDTDADDQAPPRHDIDGRELLREHERVPKREHDDAGPEPDR